MVAGTAGEVTVFDPDHKPVEFDSKGFDHFG
jgi:thiamine-monophosphate kinase